MSGGFFKMNRGWGAHPVFKNNLERFAFLWLVENAAWKETSTQVQGKRVALKRGQLSYSIRFLSEAWECSIQSTRTILKKFEGWGQINTESNNGQTVITICNYAKYQDKQQASNTEDNNDPTSLQQASNTNKEELKEIKKIDASLLELSVGDVSEWLTKKRVAGKYLTVDEDALLEKFKNYCEANNKKYKNYVAAFKNAFDWDNVPKKSGGKPWTPF